MTVAHARALLKNPVLADADPHGDRVALERLARWALRFSPTVGLGTPSLRGGRDSLGARDAHEPDCIFVDIAGCERVFHGEECLLGLISAGLTGLHLHHRLGVAPTIGAAWAAAHFGNEIITRVGNTVPGRIAHEDAPGSAPLPTADSMFIFNFLSPLPIAALRLPARVVENLTELGLDRVEDLLRLPRVSIPSRFGPEVLQRLDQALGAVHEAITPIRLDPPLRLDRLLEGPTTNHEAIELVIRELLRMLQDELSRRESGVVSLALQLDRLKRDCRGTESVEERLRLSRPTRSPRHLWSLLRPRVERVHLGYGVEGISLLVVRQRRLKHRQLSRKDFVSRGGGALQRHDEAAENQSSSELIDTLVNRLGEDRVVRVRERDSHTPERTSTFEPVIGTQQRGNDATGVLHRAEARCHPHPHPHPHGARPSVLLDRPEPAHAIAMMPDRPPSLMRWQGQELRILTGIGPERIGGEWWRWTRDKGTKGQRDKVEDNSLPCHCATLSLSFRDYFRVQDHTGRWLWVFRAEGRWFVHGIWA
jgi:protein ImuB